MHLSQQNGQRVALDLIMIRPTMDSALWKHILYQKEEIKVILDCGANNRLMWKKGNPNSNLGRSVCIKPTSHQDTLVEGIWLHLATKFTIMLWRVKWEFLTYFAILQKWKIKTQAICLLCQKQESFTHPFFNCDCTRKILLEIVEALGVQDTPFERSPTYISQPLSIPNHLIYVYYKFNKMCKYIACLKHSMVLNYLDIYTMYFFQNTFSYRQRRYGKHP